MYDNQQIESNRDAGSSSLFNVALAAGAIFMGVGAVKKIGKNFGKGAAKEAEEVVAKEAEQVTAQTAEEVAGNTANKVVQAKNINKEDLFKMQDMANEVGYNGFAKSSSSSSAKDAAADILNRANGNMDKAKEIMSSRAGHKAQSVENLDDWVKMRKSMTGQEIAQDRAFVRDMESGRNITQHSSAFNDIHSSIETGEKISADLGNQVLNEKTSMFNNANSKF